MFKKITLYSSVNSSLQPFSYLLEELSQRDFAFELRTNQPACDLLNTFNEKHWQRKISWLGPRPGSKISDRLFRYLLPFVRLGVYANWQWNKSNLPATIICFGWPEKLLFTGVAKRFGVKTIWLELPDNQIPRAGWKSYKKLSRLATILTLNHHTKAKLEKSGIDPEIIKVMQPGIKLQQYTHQDDLYHNLADRTRPGKKYFTIGTVTDLDEQQKIESLFQAVKKCLTIIPNLQLIVVGEGKEKKNLLWLAKKMEIDNLVWLVGGQAHLRKWIESFDLYIATNEKLDLQELITTLCVMSAERPVIGQADSGLEDLIFDAKTGYLMNLSDSESLAEKIMVLHQDKEIRRQLGKQALERVEKYFTSAKMLEQFEKLL
ncbi:glycosyltransferase [Candidatus Falkowbacteria bacterium]|nr:glycosyltransferase [Candidatus Falkowbacteria bacterium]